MAPSRRKSYTASFKLSVVKRATEIGNRAAAREFEVDERCIQRWKSEQEELAKMPKNKRSRRTGVVAWPILEDNLKKWATEQREKGLSISTVRIRLQAKVIAEQMGIKNFVGGPNWCFRFMKRNKLSVRTKTTVGQKLPADWLEKKIAFLEHTTKKIKEKKLSKGHIINMDEVPITFDCPPSRTVSFKGEKTVSILTTGNEKTSLTCVLSCAANGEKLNPMLIFKRKTVPKGNFPKDVICANEKGWMCEEVMLFWLREIYKKRKGSFFQPEGLIILDSMRSHLVDSVKAEAKKLRTDLSVIPGGLTKILQPLDLTINRIFKHELRKQWEDWMRSGLHSFTNSGRMRKATYEEVALWVDTAWKSVGTDKIKSAFIKAEIVEKEDCEEEDNSDSEQSDKSDIDIDLLNLFNSDTDESDFEGFV